MNDLDEARMQELLRSHLSGKGHEFITPNVNLWSWESDLVGVTQAGYAYGYEIKVTRSDFRRDFRKRRHEVLSAVDADSIRRGPSRFFYAVPPGLVEPEEVPGHAGLIHVSQKEKRGRVVAEVEEVRAAPRRHSNKIGRRRLRYLARGLGCRYWQLRHRHKEAANG